MRSSMYTSKKKYIFSTGNLLFINFFKFLIKILGKNQFNHYVI